MRLSNFSESEVFAVASEYFFEEPEKMEKQQLDLPDVEGML